MRQLAYLANRKYHTRTTVVLHAVLSGRIQRLTVSVRTALYDVGGQNLGHGKQQRCRRQNVRVEMSSDWRMIYRRLAISSARTCARTTRASLMNDVVVGARAAAATAMTRRRRRSGLISASNKHTKFGAVFGVD